ncbi:hypothetical protein SCLCIDRAFT_148789 [Scleroderma citrinum Foug A]|uniref:Uncharacterized protein n=1 Tax=Scleroderma citrinum Foug A TaxID=1036808 RepID=A0A0C3A9J8_9AGAM|nr:hypothetical protein SCLCIDRAFT_148789 [Scleroderma citrinum Foug A]
MFIFSLLIPPIILELYCRYRPFCTTYFPTRRLLDPCPLTSLFFLVNGGALPFLTCPSHPIAVHQTFAPCYLSSRVSVLWVASGPCLHLFFMSNSCLRRFVQWCINQYHGLFLVAEFLTSPSRPNILPTNLSATSCPIIATYFFFRSIYAVAFCAYPYSLSIWLTC